jgi:hypothetical protein
MYKNIYIYVHVRGCAQNFRVYEFKKVGPQTGPDSESLVSWNTIFEALY